MERKTGNTARAHIETLLCCLVCALYILFLLKLLLLSRMPLAGPGEGLSAAERSVNLTPFASICGYATTDSETVRRFAFSNVIGNLIAFVPLGAYLQLFLRNKRIGRSMLWVFLISVAVEIVQYAFAMGTADIDDLILNTLGGCIGILGYRLLRLIFRDDRRTRTALTVLSMLGLPVLIYLLFFINLRL